jgi:hypothetical protein
MKTDNPPLPPFRKGGWGDLKVVFYVFLLTFSLQITIGIPSGCRSILEPNNSSQQWLTWCERLTSKPLRLLFRQESFLIIPGGDAKEMTANKKRKSTIN